MIEQKSRVRLTAGRVADFACRPGKSQSFLWDTDTPVLALRATPTGRKTYVFESRLNGATVRINIGTAAEWSIEVARTKANSLKMMVDSGTDPREVERQQLADQNARKAAAAVHAVTVGEVWTIYLDARKPQWGERHYSDHLKLSAAGGVPFKRGTGTTQAGPLAQLMEVRLRDLTAPLIEAWAAREAQTRPTSARLAWRLLKGFIAWCNEQTEYSGLLNGNPAKTKKARESLGRPGVKSDVLQRGQLGVWFSAVLKLQNPTISAYLQTLLLTGARPGEVMTLRWGDLNTQWKGISIRDKVEGTREIPLTPYVWHLLGALRRRNEWVFSSPTSASGYLTEPTFPHTRACKAAALDGLTLHGLRRSFKSLTEWLEVPVGVVAQIQGHKPSATAEKHYTVRPLELLALHHEKIEAWILEQAGIAFDAKAEPGALRVVNG